MENGKDSPVVKGWTPVDAEPIKAAANAAAGAEPVTPTVETPVVRWNPDWDDKAPKAKLPDKK